MRRCAVAGFGSPLRTPGLALLVVLTVACVTAVDGGYMYQDVVDCLYSEDLSDMVYQISLVFNQKLLCKYDSQLGKYVGYDEYGEKNAYHYNHQDGKLKLRKEELETVCKHNAKYFNISTLQRKVPPNVTVRAHGKAHYGHMTMLECQVYGFYPEAIRVTWLKDGVEVTEGVSASDTLANGDWTYQFRTYLELRPLHGERVGCRVEHGSLGKPLEVFWDSSALDSRIQKVAVGVSSLFLGLMVAIAGGLYYYWKKHHGFASVPLR